MTRLVMTNGSLFAVYDCRKRIAEYTAPPGEVGPEEIEALRVADHSKPLVNPSTTQEKPQ